MSDDELTSRDPAWWVEQKAYMQSSGDKLMALLDEMGKDGDWRARHDFAGIMGMIWPLFSLAERNENERAELESALASERAKREQAEQDRDEFKRLFTECHPVHLDGVLRALAAEAVIEQVRVWKRGPVPRGTGRLHSISDLDTILATADLSALREHDAKVKADGQKELLAWLDLRVSAEELDMAAENFGVEIEWSDRRASNVPR